VIAEILSFIADSNYLIEEYNTPNLDPIHLLSEEKLLEEEVFYFRNRQHSYIFLGLGCFKSWEFNNREELFYEALSSVGSLYFSNSNFNKPLYFGSTFKQKKTGIDLWSDFPQQLICLPEIALIKREKNLTLFSQQNSDKAKLSIIREKINSLYSWPLSQLSLTNLSTKKEEVVNTALSETKELFIRAQNLLRERAANKVVVAKFIKLDKLTKPKLVKTEKIRTLYEIFWQVKKNISILSKTPESLLRVEESGGRKEIFIEALGGTFPANYSLTKIEKNKLIKEHQFIVDDITRVLIESNLSYTKYQLSVLKLKSINHYLTEFKARELGYLHLGSIIKELYPTSAICGSPRTIALGIIDEVEEINRGWYSGYMGVISEKYLETAVLLRMVQTQQSKGFAFAGCGIVDDSVDATELEELRGKFFSFLI
jgi:menaquinone-specific isochorismate synthase